MKIPKRFIRIWIGDQQIPAEFEKWWEEFKVIHPDYEFITLGGLATLPISDNLRAVYEQSNSCSAASDVLRIVALYELGGIYIDTDIMPLKKFDNLLEEDTPFLGKRSSKSFEAAVIGSPAKHPALKDTMDAMPAWFEEYKHTSMPTGPRFISSVLFGRPDVRHLPTKSFYPFNGFGAPKREDKVTMFSDKNNFPPEMYAAHFSNHRWGGKLFDKKK